MVNLQNAILLGGRFYICFPETCCFQASKGANNNNDGETSKEASLELGHEQENDSSISNESCITKYFTC